MRVTFGGLTIAAGGFGVVMFWPTPAAAMHISEGILPLPWAGLWFVVAVPFLAWGIAVIKRRAAVEPRFPSLVALVGAAVFVISCMPIPIPWLGTCSHPTGVGLSVLLIGVGPTIVVTSIALLVQALFLAHGGLLTLGGNLVSMGIAGSLAAALTCGLLRRLRVPFAGAVWCAATISDWVTYAMTAFELSAALHGPGTFWTMFGAIGVAFVPTQLPLGVLEGFLATFAVGFVRGRRPEWLRLASATPEAE